MLWNTCCSHLCGCIGRFTSRMVRMTGRSAVSAVSRCGYIQWRRQLVGTWARRTCPPPLAFERIFFSLRYTLKQVVCFGLVLCQTLTQHYVQPYSLWNDAIIGYNGACAKVVFTARRHVLARTLLSAGVRPSVSPPRSCTLLYPDG